MDKTPKSSTTSRKIVITPDQIAKLGLTAKLQSVIATQLKQKTGSTTPLAQKSTGDRNETRITYVCRNTQPKMLTKKSSVSLVNINDASANSSVPKKLENQKVLKSDISNKNINKTESDRLQRLKRDETASILLQLNPANQLPIVNENTNKEKHKQLHSYKSVTVRAGSNETLTTSHSRDSDNSLNECTISQGKEAVDDNSVEKETKSPSLIRLRSNLHNKLNANSSLKDGKQFQPRLSSLKAASLSGKHRIQDSLRLVLKQLRKPAAATTSTKSDDSSSKGPNNKSNLEADEKNACVMIDCDEKDESSKNNNSDSKEKNKTNLGDEAIACKAKQNNEDVSSREQGVLNQNEPSSINDDKGNDKPTNTFLQKTNHKSNTKSTNCMSKSEDFNDLVNVKECVEDKSSSKDKLTSDLAKAKEYQSESESGSVFVAEKDSGISAHTLEINEKVGNGNIKKSVSLQNVKEAISVEEESEDIEKIREFIKASDPKEKTHREYESVLNKKHLHKEESKCLQKDESVIKSGDLQKVMVPRTGNNLPSGKDFLKKGNKHVQKFHNIQENQSLQKDSRNEDQTRNTNPQKDTKQYEKELALDISKTLLKLSQTIPQHKRTVTTEKESNIPTDNVSQSEYLEDEIDTNLELTTKQDNILIEKEFDRKLESKLNTNEQSKIKSAEVEASKLEANSDSEASTSDKQIPESTSDDLLALASSQIAPSKSGEDFQKTIESCLKKATSEIEPAASVLPSCRKSSQGFNEELEISSKNPQKKTFADQTSFSASGSTPGTEATETSLASSSSPAVQTSILPAESKPSQEPTSLGILPRRKRITKPKILPKKPNLGKSSPVASSISSIVGINNENVKNTPNSFIDNKDQIKEEFIRTNEEIVKKSNRRDEEIAETSAGNGEKVSIQRNQENFESDGNIVSNEEVVKKSNRRDEDIVETSAGNGEKVLIQRNEKNVESDGNGVKISIQRNEEMAEASGVSAGSIIKRTERMVDSGERSVEEICDEKNKEVIGRDIVTALEGNEKSVILSAHKNDEISNENMVESNEGSIERMCYRKNKEAIERNIETDHEVNEKNVNSVQKNYEISNKNMVECIEESVESTCKNEETTRKNIITHEENKKNVSLYAHNSDISSNEIMVECVEGSAETICDEKNEEAFGRNIETAYGGNEKNINHSVQKNDEVSNKIIVKCTKESVESMCEEKNEESTGRNIITHEENEKNIDLFSHITDEILNENISESVEGNTDRICNEKNEKAIQRNIETAHEAHEKNANHFVEKNGEISSEIKGDKNAEDVRTTSEQLNEETVKRPDLSSIDVQNKTKEKQNETKLITRTTSLTTSTQKSPEPSSFMKESSKSINAKPVNDFSTDLKHLQNPVPSVKITENLLVQQKSTAENVQVFNPSSKELHHSSIPFTPRSKTLEAHDPSSEIMDKSVTYIVKQKCIDSSISSTSKKEDHSQSLQAIDPPTLSTINNSIPTQKSESKSSESIQTSSKRGNSLDSLSKNLDESSSPNQKLQSQVLEAIARPISLNPSMVKEQQQKSENPDRVSSKLEDSFLDKSSKRLQTVNISKRLDDSTIPVQKLPSQTLQTVKTFKQKLQKPQNLDAFDPPTSITENISISSLPKKKPEFNSLKTNTSSTTLDGSSVSTELITPKRKGRPKKCSAATSPVLSPVLGKRKRASINYAAMNEGYEECYKTLEVDAKTLRVKTPSSTDTSTPKRKGRPRRGAASQDEEAIKDINNLDNRNKAIKSITEETSVPISAFEDGRLTNNDDNDNGENQKVGKTPEDERPNKTASVEEGSIKAHEINGHTSLQKKKSFQSKSEKKKKNEESKEIDTQNDDVLEHDTQKTLINSTTDEGSMIVIEEIVEEINNSTNDTTDVTSTVEPIIPTKNVTSTVEPIIPIKRKAGRPRKLKYGESESTPTQTDSILKNESVNLKTDEKRAKEDDDENNESVEVPKRRGRKRKLPLIADESIEEEPVDENKNTQLDENPTPKRRGRKRKVVETPANAEENLDQEGDCNEENSNEKTADDEETKEKSTDEKKKHRKNKAGRVGVEDENETMNEKVNRILVTAYFDEIGRIMTKYKSMDLDEDENKKVPKDFVKCAICRKALHKKSWPLHKQKNHNNLAWTIDDQELDLKNVSFVMSTLAKLYTKKKPLHCQKCGVTKKSGIGYLGHFMQCQQTMEELEIYKIQCPECEIKVWPYSILEHMKWHKTVEQKKQLDAEIAEEVEKMRDGKENGVLRKREAAKKANYLIQSVSNDIYESDKESKRVYKLQKIKIADSEYEKHISKSEQAITCIINNCNHESKTLEEAQEHFKLCKWYLENSYSCKFCEMSFKTKKEFYFHFSNTHKDGSDYEKEDQGSDSESEVEGEEHVQRRIRQPVKSDWRPIQLKFSNDASYIEGHSLYLNHWCYKSQLEFCEKNFNTAFSLFSDVEGKWSLLDRAVIKNYLPKVKLSIPTNHEVRAQGNYTEGFKSQEFKQYKLFEPNFINDHNIIFCGGPISSMSWAPTPYNIEDSSQILAIAVFPDPQKPYSVTNVYRDKSIIQFWNYGVLNNLHGFSTAPKLEFCLAHDSGPIWMIEWCPSGCHTEEQLGLIAVSGSDSIVYGYRIPQIGKLSGVMYKADPIFKLVSTKLTDLNISGVNYYGSRISWSKASGHEHICIGYSNGLISVFDLKNQTELLCEESKGVRVFYPYATFHGHNAVVTGVALYHMHGGHKWLASTSLDRTVKFWNLEDVGGPISTKRKCQIREMVWLNNWISTIDAPDDWTNPLIQTTSVTQLREISVHHICTVMYAFSSVNSIGASDWSNMVVQGSLMGELIGTFIKHMLPFAMEIPLKRYYMSNTRLMTMTGEKINDCDEMGRFYDYRSSVENSKLGFVDYNLKCYTKVMKNTEQYSSHKGVYDHVKMQMYPIQSITCVRMNPNRYSFLYTAVGYQAGFVRIVHSKFLA